MTLCRPKAEKLSICEALKWYCQRLNGLCQYELVDRKTSESLKEQAAGPPTHAESARKVNHEGPVQPIREWSDLTVTFISDERVTIKFSGADAETRNYEEMGFSDGRIGKPCLAWMVLRELSREPGAPMRMDKKRAQEIRTKLRRRFSIDSSPLQFEKGLGHSARFKLHRSPSFDT